MESVIAYGHQLFSSRDRGAALSGHGLAPAASSMRIGILGCANIARQFVRDLAGHPFAKVVAVASRNLATASDFAKAFEIDRCYGSYEALLADPAVDMVYLPLPNSLHAAWAIKAAEAGKHILCEKPLALSLSEARAMFAAARQNDVMLLEAFPYYFQPQTGAMLELLHRGEIGQVRSVQASFGFTLSKPKGNIRLNPELGGGALLDAGCYALSLIRLVMGVAPQKVMADATWAVPGVDMSLMATLYYADGRRAQLSCAMDTANHRHATIVGSDGTIETEYLNHTSDRAGGRAHGYLPSLLRVRRGIANTMPFETIPAGTGSGFRFAVEAFTQVIRARDVAAIDRAAQASLDNSATLEALALSARTVGVVAVAPC